MTQTRWELVVTSDNQTPTRVPVDSDLIKVGSHSRAQLRIEDPAVGPMHGLIEQKGDALVWLDLGSGRGSFINGARCNRATLEVGDVIRVGNTEIRVDVPRVAEAVEEIELEEIVEASPAVPDEVSYSRRFLARPMRSDGAIEYAVLYNDHVFADRIVATPQPITVGPADADVIVEHPSVGVRTVPLVDVNEAGQPLLRIPVDAEAEVYVGTDRYTLAEAVAAGVGRTFGSDVIFPFGVSTRARVRFGAVSVFVRRGTNPKVRMPFAAQGRGLSFVGGSAILHGLLMLVILMTVPKLGQTSLDGFDPEDRFVEHLVQTPEEATPEPELADLMVDEPTETPDAQNGATDGTEGGQAPTAQSDGTDVPDAPAIEGAIGAPRTTEEAIELASNRGINQVLSDHGINRMFGSANADNGTDWGAIGESDRAMALVYGDGGLAGTCDPDTERCLGGIGGPRGNGFDGGPIRIGRPGGTGDDPIPTPTVSRRDDGPVGPTAQPDDEGATILGQLDRDLIRRVIREHRREIRSCYESQLRTDPTLEGRVVVRFTISADGSVASASIAESDVASDAVGECMANRVERWRFPETENGGLVRVSYPFVFTSGG